MKQFEMIAEVRLDAPMHVEGDLPPAVGYFRQYEVAASSQEEAMALVSDDVKTDGGHIVRFEHAKTIRHGPSTAPTSITWRSGKTYFPEETVQGE